MIKISIKCFHEDEEGGLGDAFEMTPYNLLEFSSMSFQCPECGHEVIMKMELEDND